MLKLKNDADDWLAIGIIIFMELDKESNQKSNQSFKSKIYKQYLLALFLIDLQI